MRACSWVLLPALGSSSASADLLDQGAVAGPRREGRSCWIQGQVKGQGQGGGGLTHRLKWAGARGGRPDSSPHVFRKSCINSQVNYINSFRSPHTHTTATGEAAAPGTAGVGSADAALPVAGGEGGWTRDLSALSGGQRSVVSLMLLLAAARVGAHSSLLLLDEVDSALDEQVRR